MKTNYEQDFRVIPSAIPLKSPSPDHKSSNNLTPTKSPNTIHIQKSITPPKVHLPQPKKSKLQFDLSTSLKYQSHSPSYPNKEQTALQEKDEVIRNLKNIINTITENSRHGKGESEDNGELKNQIKILTIQNQKLVSIIEKGKMSKQGTITQQTLSQLTSYEKEISQLMETIRTNENQHQGQMNEVKKMYKNTMNHCKSIEDENKQLTKQNDKLLRMLKQQREMKEKLKTSEMSEEGETQSKIGNKSERLTLVKIKEQYAENLRLLKISLQEQMKEAFETMTIALNDIDVKSITLVNRLASIEKIVWDRVKSGEKVKKSQIYIEEAPSSSSDHEKISKDEFSRVLLNEKDELEEKLANVSAQLQELRFKYDKMCLDTSTVRYSQRELEAERKYEEVVKIVQEREKEINILYSQLKQLQEEKYELNESKTKEFQTIHVEKNEREKELITQHEHEISQLKEETEMKVKLLIENYEKQLQMLRKQIIVKSASLSDISDMSNQEKLQLLQTIQDLNKKIEAEVAQSRAKISQLEKKNIEQEIQYHDTLGERNTLMGQVEELKIQLEEMKENKGNKQKQIIMQLVEINKYKGECTQLEERVMDLKEMMNKKQKENEDLHLRILKEGDQAAKMKKECEKNNKIIQNFKKEASQQKIHIKQQLEQIKVMIRENAGTSSITQMKTEILTFSQEIQKKKGEIIELKRKNMLLENQLREKQELIINLKQKVAQYQNVVQLYKKDLKKHREQNEKLQTNISALQASMRSEVEEKVVKVEVGEEVNVKIINRLTELIEIQDSRYKNLQTILHQ